MLWLGEGLKGLRGLRLSFTGVSAAEISGAGAELCCFYPCGSGRARSTVSSVVMVKVWGKSGLKEERGSKKGFK